MLTDPTAKHLINIVGGLFSFEFEGEDESLCWVSLHAWRILISKKYEAAIPALIDRLLLNPEDDWATEDITRGLTEMGCAAIDPILNLFKEEIIFGSLVYAYAGLLEALEAIAQDHPQERVRILSFLRDMLRGFETLPPALNSFIVCTALELHDVEAAPLIQKLFERKFLVEEIVDWKLVKEKLPEARLLSKIKTEKLDDDNLQYSGDENFQKLLKSLGATMNVDELKCSALGFILGIDFIQPIEFVNRIIEEASEEGGGIQSEGQALYFYRELFGLWNELTGYQNKFFQLPEFDLSRTAGLSPTMIDSVILNSRSFHIEYFVESFKFASANANVYAGSKMSEFIEFFEQKLSEVDELEQSGRASSEAAQSLVREIDFYWNQNYLVFARQCLEYREKKIASEKFVQDHKEIGRNDLCPCGSGKKFKKCCLAH